MRYVSWRTSPADRKYLRMSYALVGAAVAMLAITAAVRPLLHLATPGSADGALPDSGVITDSLSGAASRDGVSGDCPTQSDPAPPDTQPSTAGRLNTAVITPLDEDFFSAFKLERDMARSRELETMERLAEDPAADAEVRKRAQEALLASAERARREFVAESMVRAKGYDDAAVLISEDGACVVVKSGRLEEMGVRQIGDAVARATGVELRRITIMERDR